MEIDNFDIIRSHRDFIDTKLDRDVIHSKTVWKRYCQRVVADANDTFEEMMIKVDLNNGEEI